MASLPAILLVPAAYLLGSVPFALLLGLSRGVDIRQEGSGNIGATNLGRSLGRRWAVAAFLLDYLKGFLPLLSIQLLSLSTPVSNLRLALAAGAAAILGHIFPVYLRFRGGKGVATAFGVMTALAWQATLAAGVLWLGAYLATRIVAVASLVAAFSFPVGVWLTLPPEIAGSAEALGLKLFSVAVAVVIVVRHRSNLARLLHGEELRFGKRAGRKDLLEGEQGLEKRE